MGINKRYALFDWDNTIRNGYTLFSWVDYLCTHSIVDSYLQYELNEIKKQYYKNQLTHDQYAEIACLKYAKALQGIHIQIIEQALSDYIVYDREYLFKQIELLFKILNSKGIDIIVVSGAPSIIIERYKKEFHIKSIYAFKESVSDNIFTGDVEYNYGFNKKRKVLEIIEEYDAYPYMAFGDSDSDIPMLYHAKYGFYINALADSNYISIEPHNMSEGLLKKIKTLLKS